MSTFEFRSVLELGDEEVQIMLGASLERRETSSDGEQYMD